MRPKTLSLIVVGCLITIASISGCSSKPLYQKWNGDQGYQDDTLDFSFVRLPSGFIRMVRDSLENRYVYVVTFHGSRTEDGAWCGAMYRAAEFTIEHGGDYFRLLSDTVLVNGRWYPPALFVGENDIGRRKDTMKSSIDNGKNENDIIAGRVTGGKVHSISNSSGPGIGLGFNSPRPVCIKTFTIGKGLVPTGCYSARDVLAQYRK